MFPLKPDSSAPEDETDPSRGPRQQVAMREAQEAEAEKTRH